MEFSPIRAGFQQKLGPFDPSQSSVACDPDCDEPNNAPYTGLIHDEQSAYDLLSIAKQKVHLKFLLANLGFNYEKLDPLHGLALFAVCRKV